MNVAVPPWVPTALSEARFTPYLRHCAGDVNQAIALYHWNIEVSAAFFGPLHWVETTTRNALHATLIDHFGSTEWWNFAPLETNGVRMVQDARRHAARPGPVRPNLSDRMVAELSLGFWVALLAGRYHRTLWVPALASIFPGRSRRHVHGDFEAVRDLRNRIMHHEPIHHRNLTDDHDRLRGLVRQICPEVDPVIDPHDRVPMVIARRPNGPT